jgi:hypothetical protein
MVLRIVKNYTFYAWTAVAFIEAILFVILVLFCQLSLPGANFVDDWMAALAYTFSLGNFFYGMTVLIALFAYFMRANPAKASIFPAFVLIVLGVFAAVSVASFVLFILITFSNCDTDHRLTACNGLNDDRLRWQQIFALVVSALGAFVACVTLFFAVFLNKHQLSELVGSGTLTPAQRIAADKQQ